MTDNFENSAPEDTIPLDEEQKSEPQKDVINFNINDQRIAEAKELYKDIDAHQDMDAAKAAKKVLTKMRTTLGEAHKEQKAESLAYGRRLDGEKNRLLALIGEIEDPITKQIKDIKEAAERKEQERVDAITAHIDRLNSYASDRHDLDLEQIQERRKNLAAEVIEVDRYEEFLGDAKMAAEEADTKLRIVEQRELDAIEERNRQAKIAEENEARQKELDERQAEMDRQEAERKKEQEERDEAARKEQAAKDAERQAELDKQAEEQAAEQKRLDDEKAERDRVAREEQEAKDRAEREEAERLAELARAPDREKIIAFARSIETMVEAKPTMQSQEGANTMLFACEQLTELAETIRKCVEEMK